MSFLRPPKFLVIDDFLPASLADDLLAFAMENENSFHPTGVTRLGGGVVDPNVRVSGQCEHGIGPHKAAFKAAIHARFDEFVADLGITPFALARTEIQLIAHGNDAFYKSHIDTHIGSDTEEDTVRVFSAVYYFHRRPKSFTGGEIALLSFGGGEVTEVIEPVHNRLVLFPSFARHEVRKISIPSGAFGDSRFAINCWLRKERPPARPSACSPNTPNAAT